MFFTYYQHNPGGTFIIDEKVGHCVCIEADTPEEANERMTLVVGHELDDGHWNAKWRADQGDPEPSYYGEWRLLKMEDYFGVDNLTPLDDRFVVDIYYRDHHVRKEYDAKTLYKKGKKARQDKADKLWGTCVNLSGLYHKKPIRVYKDETLNTYYDRAGNFSIPGVGLNTSDYGVIYFASENKKDVEVFIAGAMDLQKKVSEVVASEVNNYRDIRKEGAKAVATLLKRWCD